MKPHVKIYTDRFGTTSLCCEICGAVMVDVHHIDPRGMGGKNKKADRIENLMGVCRPCHIKYGDKKQYKQMLKDIHKKFMETH